MIGKRCGSDLSRKVASTYYVNFTSIANYVMVPNCLGTVPSSPIKHNKKTPNPSSVILLSFTVNGWQVTMFILQLTKQSSTVYSMYLPPTFSRALLVSRLWPESFFSSRCEIFWWRMSCSCWCRCSSSQGSIFWSEAIPPLPPPHPQRRKITFPPPALCLFLPFTDHFAFILPSLLLLI